MSFADQVKRGIYRHYKGRDYEVLELARHCETEEWHVVYRCLYGDYSVWIRSATDFCSQVNLGEGRTVPRFVRSQQLPEPL